MKPIIALAAATMVVSVANATPPVVETFNPTQPSGYDPGIMTIKGEKIRVVLHNFGTQDVEMARNFGAHLAPIPYAESKFDELAIHRASELYPGDRYFIRNFDLQARVAYVQAMQGYRNSIQQ
jgi:hypothetical protein